MCGHAESSACGGALPLVLAEQGRSYRVTQITGGHGMRRRLTDMGFVAGEVVTVAGSHGGALIVRIMDYRLVISRGMARRIMVRPLG